LIHEWLPILSIVIVHFQRLNINRVVIRLVSAWLRKKVLIGSIISVLIALIVLGFAFGLLRLERSQPERTHYGFYLEGVKFIDGGSWNDTIVITARNVGNVDANITGCIARQQLWDMNNKNGIYSFRELFSAQLTGDLIIPANSTHDIHLTLPSNTLIVGKTYFVGLTAKYGSASIEDRFVYYHWMNPSANGPIEEAAIVSVKDGIIPLNYHDAISVTVQNTGDKPLTITNGLVNGMIAEKLTQYEGKYVLEKNSTLEFEMFFPGNSTLLKLKQDNTPLDIKLVTAEGYIIQNPDIYYYYQTTSWNDLGTFYERIVPVQENLYLLNTGFFSNIGNSSSVSLTLYNSGQNPITVTGCLVDGKQTTLLSTVIEKTKTVEVNLGPVVKGMQYQIVLVSSENNAFVYTVTND
jgi:hypothetical protein